MAGNSKKLPEVVYLFFFPNKSPKQILFLKANCGRKNWDRQSRWIVSSYRPAKPEEPEAPEEPVEQSELSQSGRAIPQRGLPAEPSASLKEMPRL